MNGEPNGNEKLKTSALFEDNKAGGSPAGGSPADNHFTKSKKKSKAAVFFYILSITGVIIGSSFIAAIFTGMFSVPSSSENMEMGRTDAIIGSVVSVGLAALFALLASVISKNADAVSAENELPPH
ncbi:MAG: hypothetical protein FWE82_03140, partial [Defluviitaleaceae bacterium]|nr:hypothetical protein [Defluviitaleaceae bacterium]